MSRLSDQIANQIQPKELDPHVLKKETTIHKQPPKPRGKRGIVIAGYYNE